MSTNPRKRPLGLKAQQKVGQQQSRSKKPCQTGTADDDSSSFTAVALMGSNKVESDENQTDGVTCDDLVELKRQAEELMDNPTGMEAEDEQLVNLLRGICHEAIRLIEIAEKHEPEGQPCFRVPHQMIAWASLELAIFLQLNPNSDKFVQPDEPKTLDAWLVIVAQVIDKLPAKDPIVQAVEEHIDLQLLPHSISLLKAQRNDEIRVALELLLKQSASEETKYTYLLRTIDRLILFKSNLIAEDPTPIFKLLIEFLQTIRSRGPHELEGRKMDNIQDFHRLIDQRLADCYLTHGSLLADQLENQYYPQDDHEEEQQDDEEEDFKIDLESPTYKLSIETLKLAEQTFSNLLVDIEDSDELKDLLKSKLDETLLTLGNLLPPGQEREELYLRAGLNNDDEEQSPKFE